LAVGRRNKEFITLFLRLLLGFGLDAEYGLGGGELEGVGHGGFWGGGIIGRFS
jgi:hypothetical protein